MGNCSFVGCSSTAPLAPLVVQPCGIVEKAGLRRREGGQKDDCETLMICNIVGNFS